MTAIKDKRSIELPGVGQDPESHIRVMTRDPDLRELEAACELWRAGEISEDEYIERAIAIMMRELDGFPLTAAEREDIVDAMRLTYLTSPQWRLALQLDPFGDE